APAAPAASAPAASAPAAPAPAAAKPTAAKPGPKPAPPAKKGGVPAWVWIVVLLAIAGAAFFVLKG
ncbi:MAG: hypothetical protein JWO05_534, partial [Gemmatimonadetes bacterium]|nr:hypothetical protein [Gemmatimonadota bacterium]